MIFPFLVDFNKLCPELCKNFLSTLNKLIIIMPGLSNVRIL